MRRVFNIGVIRRLLPQRGIGPRKATLRFADLELCTSTHSVARGGRPIELTPTEFDLLEMFLRNPGQVVTRTAIQSSEKSRAVEPPLFRSV